MDATVKAVGAAVLFVEDLGRSKDFYRGAVGLAVASEDAESVAFRVGGLTVIVLQVDRAREQLHGQPTAAPNAATSGFLAAFTDDVDALHARMVERGVAFFQEPTDQPWGMRTAYFKDPAGHVWEIAQALGRPSS